LSTAKWGFLYQGQRYSWQRKRRGTPTRGLAAHRFVTFLENHDQVANASNLRGERLREHASSGMYRAMTALWLLSPSTPLLFQGQEFGSSSPFRFCRSWRCARRRRSAGAAPTHAPVPKRRRGALTALQTLLPTTRF
jgi:1,4-alpha-glucan branching enzyme